MASLRPWRRGDGRAPGLELLVIPAHGPAAIRAGGHQPLELGILARRALHPVARPRRADPQRQQGQGDDDLASHVSSLFRHGPLRRPALGWCTLRLAMDAGDQPAAATPSPTPSRLPPPSHPDTWRDRLRPAPDTAGTAPGPWHPRIAGPHGSR